jgi:L-threonylcarbamoyladenylate synthase
MRKVDISEAVEILRRGELVCLPTETVYGLGADGLNAEAVAGIFLAKGRSKANPLILHVDSMEMLESIVRDIPVKSRLLMEKFWPGPLTLVLNKTSTVPEIVTAGLDSVCVRMPKHELTLRVIGQLGRPVAAPSANKSGRPSPTNLKDLEKEMPDLAVVDGGDCQLGLESTVVDARFEEVKVLRLGGLSVEELEKVLGEKVIVVNKASVVEAPGQAFKHYSPKGQVVLIWPWESFGEKISVNNGSAYTAVEEAYADLYDRYKCGIICSADREKLYFGYEVLNLGGNSGEQASRLFSVLASTPKLLNLLNN